MAAMFDYLVDYALKNIWCTPDQDTQLIVQPAKLTPYGGAWNKVDIHRSTYPLPEAKVRFHVYQIGQLHPMLMRLFPSNQVWMRISENCTKQYMIANVYNDAGVQMPLFECWYMVTEDKNLVIALKEQDRTPINLDTDNMYFRVYSNEYFKSVRSTPNADYVKVGGKRCLNQQEILDLQYEFTHLQTLPGHAWATVNGYKVSNIDLFTAQVGDVVEYVYDSSIKRILDFKIKDLKNFNSWLDDRRKYLLHYAGRGDNTIDYNDDIDLYLLEPLAQNRHKGIYFHKNPKDAMRNLTHKDYSIPVQMVSAFVAAEPTWNDANLLTLRLHIRKSGYQRPLVYEASRIHELYKMADADVRRALLGLDSVVPEWRAENLEGAGYTQVMAFDKQTKPKPTCLSPELVQEALGYNAISKQLADTPRFVRVSSGQKVIDVPYGLQKKSTAYEYDDKGVMLAWHPHQEGSIYPARDTRTKYVEMIANYTDDQIEEVYGNVVSTLSPNANYRFYTCPIRNGQPTNEWVDVTDSGLYAVVNNQLTWFTDPDTYPMVRGDSQNLGYDLNLVPVGGILKFSLTHRVFRGGVTATQVMQIPMGELDLMLNGKSLIEDLDYIVRFPEIVINNKEYIKADDRNGPQRITVRFTGFCDKDFNRVNQEDKGWVDHALLSHNNRFDIRDDKVLRITVDGCLKDRTELLFAETHSGVIAPDARNGAPYLIRDIIVPLRGLTKENTYSLREKSRATDKRVSDYLTLKLPEKPFNNPNAIQKLYQVFSPFVCKITYDLKNGIIDDPRIWDHYGDQDVKEICEEYEYLLKYDPTQETTPVDPEYVIIHPHNLMEVIDLDIYRYTFLEKVVRLYTRGKVQLSHFIRLTVPN